MEVNEEEEGMVVIGGGAAGHTAVETLRSAQVLSHIVHIGNDNDNDIVHHQVIICTLVMMSSSPTATSASNFTSNFEANLSNIFYASIFPSQEKKKVLFQNFEEVFFSGRRALEARSPWFARSRIFLMTDQSSANLSG